MKKKYQGRHLLRKYRSIFIVQLTECILEKKEMEE